MPKNEQSSPLPLPPEPAPVETLARQVEILEKKIQEQQDTIERLKLATQILAGQRTQALDSVVNAQVELRMATAASAG